MLDLETLAPLQSWSAPRWSHSIRVLGRSGRLAVPELDRLAVLGEPTAVVAGGRLLIRLDTGHARVATDARQRLRIPPGLRARWDGRQVVISLRNDERSLVLWSAQELDVIAEAGT